MGLPVTHGYGATVFLLSGGCVRYEVRDPDGGLMLAGYAEDVDDAHDIMKEQMEVYAEACGSDCTVAVVIPRGNA